MIGHGLTRNHVRWLSSATALAIALLGTSAIAQTTTSPGTAQQPSAPPDSATQTAAAPTDPAPTQQPGDTDIVVTGFRASLNTALNAKRNETAAIDSIVSEDIGKFPDSNLAESMQRLPGVSLSRGDGGEGRNISVRGLGAQFTRVRINGLEGSSQTGGSDIFGAGNSGRSFDFSVFPSEIFSSLAVRKTPSADGEEGSLGATVDLKAPHPLDFKQDFVFTATGRAVYGELAKQVSPRASALVSKHFADDRFGILASAAYQQRVIRSVGYSAVDILNAATNGGYCSPLGYTPLAPVLNAAKGVTAANCSTGNPRTSTTAAYNTLITTGLTKVFQPRIPRYTNSTLDEERYGGTLTLQWKPDDNTDISLDGLYSRYNAVRRDNYIEAISFGRTISNNGQPMTSITDLQLTNQGSIAYGAFNGVDVRSEGLVDDFSTTFAQGTLNFEHRFSDSVKVDGLAGYSRSIWTGRSRVQTFMDAIDTPNFTFDARDGQSIPKLGFGFDVSNPANYRYAPGLTDGTVLGGFSTQSRPQRNATVQKDVEANALWNVTPAFAFKVGGQYRENDYVVTTSNVAQQQLQDATKRLGAIIPLPAGVALSSITTQITGVGDLLGRGAPNNWAAIDESKWANAVGFGNYTYCGVECGAGRSEVHEKIAAGYLMTTFNTADLLPFSLRGDAGVRYVHTRQSTVGYIPVAAPVGYTYLNMGVATTVNRDYDDWLPAVNVVLDVTHDLLLRASASSVMSRADLSQLPPSASVTALNQTATINNPNIDPIRATTYDLSAEWYFQPGALLSVAYFHKNISTYIQRVTSLIPFNQLGLPAGLLAGSNVSPTDVFSVSQYQNTPGGGLNGFEVNAQAPFRFLPGFLRNFGALASYTHVTSRINYILTSANGVALTSTTADLVGLSKNAASGTLYYEDRRFSIRGSANYRDPYIRGIPASTGSDLQGNQSTLYVDASASYNLTNNVKLIVEAQNLTDERNTLFIDSNRQDTLFELRDGRTITLGATVKF